MELKLQPGVQQEEGDKQKPQERTCRDVGSSLNVRIIGDNLDMGLAQLLEPLHGISGPLEGGLLDELHIRDDLITCNTVWQPLTAGSIIKQPGAHPAARLTVLIHCPNKHLPRLVWRQA